MPDRSLVRPWLPTYVVGRATGPSTYVFTSLGCPYRCSFCSIWPQYGGAYYQRDVESVIAELKTLDQYQVVRFADANTLVNGLRARSSIVSSRRGYEDLCHGHPRRHCGEEPAAHREAGPGRAQGRDHWLRVAGREELERYGRT